MRYKRFWIVWRYGYMVFFVGGQNNIEKKSKKDAKIIKIVIDTDSEFSYNLRTIK